MTRINPHSCYAKWLTGRRNSIDTDQDQEYIQWVSQQLLRDDVSRYRIWRELEDCIVIAKEVLDEQSTNGG